jgi:hypothetical protein
MKKNMIYIIMILLLALVIVYFIFKDNIAFLNKDKASTKVESTQILQEKIVQTPEVKDKALENFYKNIHITGLAKDGIAPIEDPKYISISEADLFLEDWDRVFVYEAKEGTFIYPQRILVWHEIVNEYIDNESISITYCPLTASTIGYTGDSGLHSDNTYGTSGNLLNSNLVMYDRKTLSNIPQILGTGVDSELEGVTLNTRPVHWAVWSDVISVFTDAKVLSTETGFIRNYNLDPYGSYLPYDKKSYYISGPPSFSLMNDNDGTFQDKKIVVGVKHLSDYVAVDPLKVKDEMVINFPIGSIKAAAFYDNKLNAVRVFNSNINGTNLVFINEDSQIVDQNNTVWQSNGVSENNESLTPLTYFDVLWFAWHAYYPDTEVIK